MSLELNLEKYDDALLNASLLGEVGKVTGVSGLVIKGYIPAASVGSICEIFPKRSKDSFSAEVVGFSGQEVKLMPLGEMRGVGLGSKIVLKSSRATIRLSDDYLGRVVDSLGQPIDNKGSIEAYAERSLYGTNVSPLERPPINEALELGVRCIDSMVTVGKGQRIGIMAGSGVGKSVLLGMMARNTEADVNVIAMIGERGREVREFVEHTLGEEGLKKSVIITATSDQSPLLRMRGAFLATTIAEHFSSKGKDVLLMMDSVTRFAMAQREIGLSTGEPPATKGYTPSVYALLPKLLERAGTFEGKGSITGLYTVLVEGDDMDDPIGDAVRSIVDGHIVLDRKLAHKAHFPAVDVLQSISRVMKNVVSDDHYQLAQLLRERLATYKDAEDLINIGAYKEGSNPKIDQSIHSYEAIINFLKQDIEEPSDIQKQVEALVGSLGGQQ